MLKNKEVRIENTNRCNAHCVTCPREKMTRPVCDMKYLDFVNLVMQVRDMGAKTISIFGYGEPLLDKFLPERIDYCDRIGMETFITTNASLLTPDKSKELLDAGLSRIRFSVHGDSNTYKNVHKNLEYNETISNINSFLAVNNKCKTDVTTMLLNGEDMNSIIKFWSNKVDNIEVWKPHNWTDGRGYRETERKKKTCGRPFSGPIQIQADGKMIVCCFDYNGVLTMGDTKTESIEDILKGREFNEIRRKHKDGDLDGLICQTCDQLNEGDDHLLYSSINKEINRSFCTKHNLEEKEKWH